MATKIKEIKAIEEGIDLISTGILLIEQHRVHLEALGGSSVVDCAARMNAQVNTMYKWLDPLKALIKDQALRDGTECVPGGYYQANVKKVSKLVLDTEAVKVWLGSKLPHFQKSRQETQISFDVKA